MAALRDCASLFQGVRADLGPWVADAVRHQAAARAAALPSNVVPLRSTADRISGERRKHAMKALQLALAVLEVELAELPESDPARFSIAGALRSAQAGALYLEPTEGAPS